MYSIASNGSPHVLETVTVGCEGTAEADEALSILVPSIAPSTRCVAAFSVTPSETGTVELQIGPGSSDAGPFAEQNLILEVLPAVAIEPDGGMNEVDAGIADGGVDGPDAARPPVMVDDNREVLKKKAPYPFLGEVPWVPDFPEPSAWRELAGAGFEIYRKLAT